jgi:hypothetical protein
MIARDTIVSFTRAVGTSMGIPTHMFASFNLKPATTSLLGRDRVFALRA